MKNVIFSFVVLCCTLTGVACAETPAYGNWTEITASAGFSPRYDYGTVAFNDQLWIIGGHIQNAFLWGCSGNSTCDMNDVWSSADGKNWTLVTDNAGFSPRSGSGVAVFNNRLWVIGGGTFDNSKNDVWSSADGKNWTLVTDNASFSPRSGSGVAVFDNRLWVIGGGTFDNLKNDVWSSADGKNWTEITDSAGFSPRYGKGVAVFDNQLWIIGGVGDSEYTDPATGYTYISEGGSKDVWSSADGKNWTLVNSGAPFKNIEFIPVTVFDNKLWIIGGGVWETMMMQTKYVVPHAGSEVWSSPDGNNWTLETGDAGFSPRFLHGTVPFNNGLVVLGGTNNYVLSNDVWYMPSLRPEQTHVPELYPTAVPTIEPVVPKTTTTKAGSAPLMVCIGLCIAAGVYLDLARRN
nr:hypothetical protein [uncultured Methanoregula sp.]